MRDYHPFSPPRLVLSPSSSTISSFSPSSTLSSRSPRAFSPPREEVLANHPLCLDEEPDDSVSDTGGDVSSVPFITPARYVETALPPIPKLPRRKSDLFKSSLTASLAALKSKLPTTLPTPTIYTPLLRQSRMDLRADPQTVETLSYSSLPTFALVNDDGPPSSTIHLQTYSVSLGPPRKPREARLNSDFLRLLALEMEMRRSGKFGVFAPELDSNGFPSHGVIVSGKVRMVLPRRSDRERDQINISTFNKSRLKW
jgi:hypothetical protein